VVAHRNDGRLEVTALWFALAGRFGVEDVAASLAKTCVWRWQERSAGEGVEG
jgi:hypothetical protein